MSMILKLDTLKIENFKGCRHLELDFHGRSASIYGDNAVGKTTVRTLLLPPKVLEVFREYRKRNVSRWLFPSPKKEDSPLLPSVVRQRLHRLLDHAGCERVRFHDLRHTFATNALAHGMDIKTLSTILGHVSAATTLNTYSHITEEMRRQAAARIDAGIAKAQPLPAEENALQERTMTDFQARKRWSRRTA